MIKEQEIVFKFTRFLNSNKGYKELSVEIPYFNRSLDLVYIENEKEVGVIEFKLNNWRRCIEQASYCLGSAEYIYICIPMNSTISKAEQLARNFGIGIITFDENITFNFRLKAKRQKTKQNLKDVLKRKLEQAVLNDNLELLSQIYT